MSPSLAFTASIATWLLRRAGPGASRGTTLGRPCGIFALALTFFAFAFAPWKLDD